MRARFPKSARRRAGIELVGVVAPIMLSVPPTQLVVDLLQRRILYRGKYVPPKPPHNIQKQQLLALATKPRDVWTMDSVESCGRRTHHSDGLTESNWSRSLALCLPHKTASGRGRNFSEGNYSKLSNSSNRGQTRRDARSSRDAQRNYAKASRTCSRRAGNARR